MLTLNRIRSSAIGFVTLALLVGLVYVTQIPAASQTPPSAPVTVVNTPANSVPVTQQGTSTISGSVSITGTPTVNVGNLPATQPVSGTVNVGNFPPTQPVSGTVDIGNLPAPTPIGHVVSIRDTLGASSARAYATSLNDASVITIWTDNSSTINAHIFGPAGEFVITVNANQTIVVPLPQKLPVTPGSGSVLVECANGTILGLARDCTFRVTIAGD